jgi:xylulokinase
MSNTYIGVDISTEGARATVVDQSAKVLARATTNLAPVVRGTDNSITQDPKSWVSAVKKVLRDVIAQSGAQPIALSITATSGTFVLTNQSGQPIAPAAMYNDGRANSPLGRALKIKESITDTSTLLLAHTPEFVVAALAGKALQDIPADWSHALKTGANLHTKTWDTQIIENAASAHIKLPNICAPGTLLGKVSKQIADELGIPQMDIYAGMTDGCTAQISASGSKVGSAVTTLGTTMVIKIVADKEVSGPGFYSHLLPSNTWLAGGASNIGGISYKKFGGRLDNMNSQATKLASYVTYPLIGVGERFPFSNGAMEALASGKAKSDTDEFRAILEGIAFAERYSYELLERAGAPIVGALHSVGGGSNSKLFTQIRASVLNRPIMVLDQSGSDIGAAKIAIAASVGGDLAEEISKIETMDGKIINPEASLSEKLNNRYQDFLSLTNAFNN